MLAPDGESYNDLHWGKFDSPLCKFVAESNGGEIPGSAGEWECSDVDVDYYARIGKRRIYHVDSQGFHYLWKYDTEEEAALDYSTMVEHLRYNEDDEEEDS